MWSLHLVYDLEFVIARELITVPLSETNHTSCVLSISSIQNRVSVISHFHWKLIKLRQTNVLYMRINVGCIHQPGELSARDETR